MRSNDGGKTFSAPSPPTAGTSDSVMPRMNRSGILGILVFAFVASCKGNTAAPPPGAGSATLGATATAKAGALQDPTGVYKPFSDASIRKPPVDGMTIGGGELVTVEWNNTKDDSLFYTVHYVDAEGVVRPVANSVFDAKGGGVFTRDLVVYDSKADGRPGFLELHSVTNTKMGSDGVTGDKVKLGMYPVLIKLKK